MHGILTTDHTDGTDRKKTKYARRSLCFIREIRGIRGKMKS